MAVTFGRGRCFRWRAFSANPVTQGGETADAMTPRAPQPSPPFLFAYRVLSYRSRAREGEKEREKHAFVHRAQSHTPEAGRRRTTRRTKTAAPRPAPRLAATVKSRGFFQPNFLLVFELLSSN